MTRNDTKILIFVFHFALPLQRCTTKNEKGRM